MRRASAEGAQISVFHTSCGPKAAGGKQNVLIFGIFLRNGIWQLSKRVGCDNLL